MVEDKITIPTGVWVFQLTESMRALGFCKKEVTCGGVPEKEGDSALWVYLHDVVGRILCVWHCRAMALETYESLSEEEYEGLRMRFPNWGESFFVGTKEIEDELWDMGNFDYKKLYLDGVVNCLDNAAAELSAVDTELARKQYLFYIGEQKLAQHLKHAIEWIFLAYNARHARQLPDRSDDPELFERLSHMLPAWGFSWRLETP